jgi:hypothetical protein
VHGRGAEAAQGAQVLARRVPHVAGEAVAGKAAVELRHARVAKDLGHDGGGGDAGLARVAADQRRLGHGEAGQRARVHQYVLRGERERRHGAPHRLEAGAVDVQAVHLGRRELGDRHRQGLRADARGELLARGAGEALRVVEARQVEGLGLREHHRGRHQRARQRAHADLVHARDPARPGRGEAALAREERGEAPRLGALVGVAPLEPRHQRSCPAPAVAAQRREPAAAGRRAAQPRDPRPDLAEREAGEVHQPSPAAPSAPSSGTARPRRRSIARTRRSSWGSRGSAAISR